MRKMKKINGFLVVRFNDREKRDYPELGRFGFIDAEDYTGDLDFDRDAMEYTDADTLEVAVEQARGLSAEEDFSQEPPTCTVIVDRAEETSVEEVEPQLLVLGQKQRLMGQIASKHHPDITPRTAAHELKGYKAALYDLGLLDADGAMEEPDAFWHAPPSDRETFLAYVCDELCGWRTPEMTQEQLDAICENCPIGRAGDAAGTPYSPGKPGPSPYSAETLAKRDTGFQNIKASIGRSPEARRIYALGLALAQDCPDNDCRVYLNIFKMAQELDAAIAGVGTYPASVLRSELLKRLQELYEMYGGNYAVQRYREGMKA